MKIYNSLTRKKEELKSLKDKTITMYVCGPTVYDYDHLGHIRTWFFFDILRRYLEFLGFSVKFAQNITDVGHLTQDEIGEDKIEKKAQQEKKDPRELARFYEAEHWKDMADFDLKKPDFSPRATDHIPQIIKFIQGLIEKKFAYEAGGSVYFDVTKFPKYGELSGRKFLEQKPGARVRIRKEKKHPADFALWLKAVPEHIMAWDSPWGKGFPGWHIECSVMNYELFGPTVDIHGGANELKFPHHENEIAQSESYSGQKFVRYWLHTGMLTINGEKMAKSKGNFITIREALKKWSANLIKIAFLSTHWRKPFDWNEQILGQAKVILEKLERAKEKSVRESNKDSQIKREFLVSLDDDFNTPQAISIWLASAEKISRSLFEEFEKILGLRLAMEKVRLTAEQEKMIQDREKARKKGAWKVADEIRRKLKQQGIQVEDTDAGPRARKF